MELVDSKWVSELTGIPVGTLKYYRHADIGLRSYRIGGRAIRYDKEEVFAWIEKQKELTGRGDAA